MRCPACSRRARWSKEASSRSRTGTPINRIARTRASGPFEIVAQERERQTNAEIQQGFQEGLVIARAQNFARGLVNEPGNVLTPTVLAQRAQWMCGEMGLVCEVHSTAKLQELGMGAFLAVAQGSAEPPALIVMTYTPEIAPDADAHRSLASSAKASPSIPAASR